MPESQTPILKTAAFFFDGQNFYRACKAAFDIWYPNFDPLKFANLLCEKNGWKPSGTHFYTGVPRHEDDPRYAAFWTEKLNTMRRKGVQATKRNLKRREKTVKLRDGTTQTIDVMVEKGVDVRIALDFIRLTHSSTYDVAVIFSQDQDLAEVVRDAHAIAKAQSRTIEIFSAYPISAKCNNHYPINDTKSICIQQDDYEKCIDERDYWTSIDRRHPRR